MEIIEKLNLISGLDTQRAIGLFGGNVALYVKILNKFVTTIGGMCDAVAAFDPETQLDRITIDVHGMKGVLANIGATELSEQARVLEFAGKDNDRETVVAGLPAFLEKIKDLSAEISGAII